METNTLPGLNRSATITILSTSGILLGWSFVCSLVNAGPVTASIITYGLYVFYWFYALFYKNPLVLRLVLFGTIAGILELVTDHYLVSTINSLIYPGKELIIWSSPAYMPFAWSNVLLQLSFIGILFTRKYGILKASVILCIAGGMYIPMYEHLAKGAGWWWYNTDVHMILNAPLYVIICEAFISLSLPLLISYAERHPISRTILLGILEGFWILFSAYAAFTISQ